jgi:hypothetical protein
MLRLAWRNRLEREDHNMKDPIPQNQGATSDLVAKEAASCDRRISSLCRRTAIVPGHCRDVPEYPDQIEGSTVGGHFGSEGDAFR